MRYSNLDKMSHYLRANISVTSMSEKKVIWKSIDEKCVQFLSPKNLKKAITFSHNFLVSRSDCLKASPNRRTSKPVPSQYSRTSSHLRPYVTYFSVILVCSFDSLIQYYVFTLQKCTKTCFGHFSSKMDLIIRQNCWTVSYKHVHIVNM
jgi:hypothetical protein